MAEKKRKSDLVLTDSSDFDASHHHRSSSEASQKVDSKRIRKISPVGMRVLVAIRKEANQTDGGLYLPEGAKQTMQDSLLAEVLEVASAVDEGSEEETNISGIPLGAMILIHKHAGTRVPWDDTLRIVDTKDVLAIVNEISIT